MQKKTLAQSITLAAAVNPLYKAQLFTEFGFTKEEASAMVDGSTAEKAYIKLGGVWKVGNVEWVQAISKEHAEKLHMWTFGLIEEAQLVKTFKQGLTWTVS